MWQHWGRALSFSFLFLFAGLIIAAPAKSAEPKRQPEVKVGVVCSITDGDTLVVLIDKKVERVRLRRVNAPEKDDPGGPEATKKLLEQFPAGTWVKVTIHARDDFARLVADLMKIEKPRPDPPKSQEKLSGKTYLYKGKERSQAWVNARYEQFKDKIAVDDGKFVDIGVAVLFPRALVEYATPAVADRIRVLNPRPAPGGWHRVRCQVFQVIGPNAALIEILSAYTEILGGDSRGNIHYGGIRDTTWLIRVGGIDTSRLVDGKAFNATDMGTPIPLDVVCVGTYRYGTAASGSNQVPSYVPWRALTKEEFAAALDAGFVLIEYSQSRNGITATPVN